MLQDQQHLVVHTLSSCQDLEAKSIATSVSSSSGSSSFGPPLLPFAVDQEQGRDRNRAICRDVNPNEVSYLRGPPQFEALIILPCGNWLALPVQTVTIDPVSKWNRRIFSFGLHRFFWVLGFSNRLTVTLVQSRTYEESKEF